MIVQRIVAYNVLEASFVSKLIERVEFALKDDWQPLGSSYYAGNVHYQAMVKHGYQEFKQQVPGGRIATPTSLKHPGGGGRG